MSAQKFIKKKAKTGEKKLKPLKPVEAVVEVKKEVEEVVVPPGKMKICVIGLGASGGLIAACLKSKRRKVTAIGDLEQKRIIRSNGLRVEGEKTRLLVDLDVQVEMQEKPDLVILAVNAIDIGNVIERNRKFLEGALILTTQNNVKADELVSLTLGRDHVISSVILFGSTYLKPGLIKYDFEGDWIMGKPFGANDDKVKEVAEEIGPAFKVTIADDITSRKWTKLLIDATFSIPALLGKSIPDVFSNLDMAQIGSALIKECIAVADDAGIKLADLPNLELNKLRQIVSLSAPETAKAFSELMGSLANKIQDKSVIDRMSWDCLSQIDYINGEIIRKGRFGRVGARLNTKAVNSAKKVQQTKKFFSLEELKQIFNQN